MAGNSAANRPETFKPMASQWKWPIGLAAVLLVSRLLYYYAGIRFSAWLDTTIAFADPALLREDLLRTVFFLHCQPPGFNLFLGLVLKAFPADYSLVFKLVYLAFGLGLALSIFFLMKGLEVPPRLAFLLTSLFMVSSPCILFENWLFYTYPTTLFLSASAFFLHRYLGSHRETDCLLFFLSAGLVPLTRSLFHPLWFAAVLLAMLLFGRGHRRKIITAAALPLVLIILLQAKNYFFFGSSSGSTWFGMNFAKITVLQLADKDRLKMYESGELSGLVLVAPFSSLETYRKYLSGIPQYRTTGIPVLDREDKSTGTPNFNSLAYIDISRGYLSDAFYVVLRRPGAYLGGILRAAVLYFQPASSQAFFKSNRRAAAAADRFCNLVLYGQPAAICGSREVPGFKERIELRRSLPGVGLFLVAAFLLSVCCGFRTVLKLRGSGTADPAAALTVAFLLFNILYVTLVGNLLELGENSRFRFMVDPCILVILGLFLRRFTVRAEKPA